MKKLIVSLHTSLDGFVGGPNGEMNWINLPDGLFDFVGTFTDAADTALYGKNTYAMMDAYWPKAGDAPDASKHDKEHSAWYNKVTKVVLSTTLPQPDKHDVKVIGKDVAAEVEKLKQQPGDKNILIFGSPTAVHYLIQHNLIDEYWLFVNPVILGGGIPMFPELKEKLKLEYIGSQNFGPVVAMHYKK